MEILQCCYESDMNLNVPLLRINETVKLIAQNLLQINVHFSYILDDNMDYINRHLEEKVLIDNERYLLLNQVIINIHNLMTKDLWEIDNKDNEIMEVTIYYKPQKELNDWFILVLATKEQQELAWKFGHNKILHLDGTFGISNKKILLFVLLVLDEQNKGIPIGYLLFSAAGGIQKASSNYNYTTLKELLLYNKHKLG
ncbi:hypothetical protein RhiirA4_475345 [Rhizophagus irregularis]|uniref:MULE transposase domain-containing protein n=1 Tax=Rhizophagus irregularis TaxID=588596 RepID=A0A2I1H9Z7_9GLOM|nr:hypothetical protein RhiirA4_475345 [Rhizophagus irregularis]